jgi:sugar phosphate isomerase/epimerase
MARGRKPQGDHPLTAAERQARYRERHARAPVLRYRRPVDRRSRWQRWQDAVAELVALQAEYARWFEALPEPFRDTATGEALQAIRDLDLDEICAIEPPHGFAQD